MKKPVIGISGSFIIDNGGSFPGYRRSYVNEDYVNSVIKNGGIPYIIPFSLDKEIILEQIKNVDGLILSGGHDVTPKFYKEEPMQKLGGISQDRDIFDFELLRNAKELNKPVLGICRGFQIMNVYFGGNLYQDLSYDKNVFIKHDQVNSPSMVSHSIDVTKDSLLESLIGNDNVMVNSFHHQIVKDVAKGFEIGAKSKDGVVESIENKDLRMIGVQWHPEMLHNSVEIMNELFKFVIKEATK